MVSTAEAIDMHNGCKRARCMRGHAGVVDEQQPRTLMCMGASPCFAAIAPQIGIEIQVHLNFGNKRPFPGTALVVQRMLLIPPCSLWSSCYASVPHGPLGPTRGPQHFDDVIIHLPVNTAARMTPAISSPPAGPTRNERRMHLLRIFVL
ncbi:hypothetical protein NUW54_g10635 [Trametes sanguinea]|uniref:Uncharacterized protein n=1 Tax=Trametes sanguinea TaxID=158606 RepID=A0ACC1NY98_9APHY|nr:hypothetical protein NUW54_g10635 [Trametes sanguinea]